MTIPAIAAQPQVAAVIAAVAHKPESSEPAGVADHDGDSDNGARKGQAVDTKA